MPRPLEERFFDKAEVIPFHECWEWSGSCDKAGYGRITLDGKSLLTHRVSWEIHNGMKIPDGAFICHHCDNPSCVKPEHLYAGSHTDNMRDRLIRGRGPKRFRNSHCRHGHEYTNENSYFHPGTGLRQCRECRRIRHIATR